MVKLGKKSVIVYVSCQKASQRNEVDIISIYNAISARFNHMNESQDIDAHIQNLYVHIQNLYVYSNNPYHESYLPE